MRGVQGGAGCHLDEPRALTGMETRLTRRRLLAAGVAGAVGAAGVGYGRFALGDEFEEHVADVLGISVEMASGLLARARDAVGDVEYGVRAAAFLAATTSPSRALMPHAARESGVHGLLRLMLEGSAGNIAYMGLRPKAPRRLACAGLLRR